jgi:hypothetical protein
MKQKTKNLINRTKRFVGYGSILNFFRAKLESSVVGISSKIILVIIFCLSSLHSFGQMNGWPLNSHGSATISSDQVLCTDRARVISMTSGSSTRTLTINNFEGSFTYGDWVMVIQMHQNTGFTGKYTMCEITSSGTSTAPGSLSTTSTIDVKPYALGSTYTNSWRSFVLGGADDIVQMVKISRFWDLTVTAGIITCPAFNYTKGTGGVLAVMVGNQFSMSGGYINVSGKGFHVKYNSGGGIGIGGVGAVSASSFLPGGSCAGSNGGSVDFPTNLGYSIPYNTGVLFKDYYGESGAILNAVSPQKFGASNVGLNGGVANNSSTVGTNTTGVFSFAFGHSNYSNHDLHLGCSGNCGMFSATGGGGGGFGGTGGSSYLNVSSGFPGYIGQNGFPGGNAGDFGIGGGILFLKVANSSLSFSNSQKRFISKGTNGGNGGNGGDGGKGGIGGFGANGGCQSGDFVSSGGMGGFGDGGAGGNGGDAGNAGCGGTIWILKKNGGTHSNFSSYVSNGAGKGGKGGSSGYKFTFMRTPRPTNYFPALSTLPCNSPGLFSLAAPYRYCPPVVCDCNEVFRHLGEDMATDVSYSNVSGSVYKITSTSNPSQSPIYWDGVDLLSYSKVTGSCTTKYECRMKRNDLFIDFMDKVMGNSSLMSYNGSGSLTSGLMTVGMNGVNTQLFSIGGHLIYEYNPTLGQLTDYDDLTYPNVTAHVCDQTTGVLIFVPGSPNGSGPGGGSGNQTVEIPFIDDAPFVGIPNGAEGSDGSDATDGEFFEDDLVSSPIPDGRNNINDLQNFYKKFENVDLIEQVADQNKHYSIGSTENGFLIINNDNLKGNYVIKNNLGQVVNKGDVKDLRIPVDLNNGVYYVHLFLNNKEYFEKIYIGSN